MQKAKIVIVEDERPIATMYDMKLRASGFDVRVAYDGKAGYDLCQAEQPDLVLLDLKLPEMMGDAMLQKMRETDWGSDTLVIILTNVSKDEAPSSLRFLNVDRYIVKAHHTPSQIVDIVNEVLDRHSISKKPS